MAKSFEVELTEDAEDLIERTRKTANEKGLIFEGDVAGGNITGQGFEGVYKVADGRIVVTIHKKPMVVPWFVVESKIKSFLA